LDNLCHDLLGNPRKTSTAFLKAEMDEHLGYSKYGRGETENSRNGVGKKSPIITG